MAKFDLKDLLNQRSKETEMQEEEYKTDGVVELIDIYKMIPSPNNFYNTKQFMDLVASIKLVGILQPVRLTESDEEEDTFDIDAGHRRREACIYLVEKEGLEQYRYIPSIVKKKDSSLMRKLALIMANRFREKSDWEKMQEVIQTEELLEKLKGDKNLNKQTREYLKEVLGIETDNKLKTRDFVAQILGTSSAQVGRYKAIYNNLCNELMTVFHEKLINVSVAAEIAGLSKEWQMMAFEMLRENKGILQITDVKKLKQQEEASKLIEGQQKLEIGNDDKKIIVVDENKTDEMAETEMFDATPKYKDILCYSCLHYAECDKKMGNVFECGTYVNKAQAEKTPEQLYSEEQDKIDRETAKKLEEKHKEEIAKNTLPCADKRAPKDDYEITVTMRQYAEIFYGHINFLVTLKKDYQFDDTITLKEYKCGEPSGREIVIKVKNVVQDCTGIEDNYCVVGFYVIAKK